MAEPRDEELQNYLDGRSRLSARYRWASRETTTPELDAAVLDYARAQAKAAPSPPQRRRSRWFIPLATAATLVMGVDLVWHLRQWAVPEAPSRAQRAETTAATAPQVESRVAADVRTPAAVPVESDTAPRLPSAVAPQAASKREAQQALAKPSAAPEAAAPPSEPLAGAVPAPDESPAVQADADAWAFAREQEDVQREAVAQEQAEAMRERREDAAAKSLAAQAAATEDPATGSALAVDQDAVAEQADELAALLRDEDFAAVKERYAVPTFPRPALQAAADVLRSGADHGSRRLTAEDGHRWRIDYLDADEQVRCTARLQRGEDGWQLLELITRP